MLWTNSEFRGCGMVVDWLRDRWLYAALALLRVQPMSPSELFAIFKDYHAASMEVFGPHSIYPESVTRHLSTLTRGGLLMPGPWEGRRRRYSPTPLGVELLDSLGDATVYARSRYEHLLRYAREQGHLDPCIAPLFLEPPSSENPQRLDRRSTALLFGAVFGPKWTYATLAALTWGSLGFGQIIEVVHRAASASPDVVSGRLVDSTLAARLDTLQHLGLVEWKPVRTGRRGAYNLTGDGRALMTALEPVAGFGIRRDAEMTAAVRAM